jgi:hypothetical protein
VRRSAKGVANAEFAFLDLLSVIEGVLATELAETTYAQIIDGLPIGDVAYDTRVPPYPGYVISYAHEELCPGMLDKAREFRDSSDRSESIMDIADPAIPRDIGAESQWVS